jgi:hypothetical protein
MQQQPQNPRRVATIIWGALVAGTTVFLVVALSLPEAVGDPQLVRVLLPVSGGMSIVTTMASWFWVVRMRPALPPGATTLTPEALALTRLIVASALCEGAALFAIVVLLATSHAVALLPFAVSFVALLAHFPRERHWARLCGGTTAPAGAARNRMIRG